MDPYTIVRLKSHPDHTFILLSYPGVETNGTVVVAPLLGEDQIAIVETLHPVVPTPMGHRVIAVERLGAVVPEIIIPTEDTLIEYDYLIHRALSRLFFGN
ncbi:MAG: hypothetical protein AAF642_16210 [Pseudomonadota bacterium]|mgnify:CR=1 FL=1